MRWLFLISGLGVLGVSAYSGWALSDGRVPVWAFCAVGVFLLVLVLPFILEYTTMGQDMTRVGGEFLSDTRRPYFPEKGEVEVFTGEGRSQMTRRREPKLLFIALVVVGLGLVALEVVEMAQHQAAKPEPDRTLTNF